VNLFRKKSMTFAKTKTGANSPGCPCPENNPLEKLIKNQSALATKLRSIQTELEKIMATLDDAIQDAQDEKTIIASVGAFIDGLKAQIAAAGTDPVKLNALVAQLDENKATLAAALTSNTPAANIK
jgi:septal ring factor EnvC (AmiA/AmiB activator)